MDPDLLDTDPPKNATKLEMSKQDIYHNASKSNNRIPNRERIINTRQYNNNNKFSQNLTEPEAWFKANK